MAETIIVFVENGRVQRVISDVDSGLRCIVVTSGDKDVDQIRGEPWVRAVDLPNVDNVRAALESFPVEFCPAETNEITGSSSAARSELMTLLGDTKNE